MSQKSKDQEVVEPDFAMEDLLSVIRKRLKPDDDEAISEEGLSPDGVYTAKEISKILGISMDATWEMLRILIFEEGAAEKTRKKIRSLGNRDTQLVPAYRLTSVLQKEAAK